MPNKVYQKFGKRLIDIVLSFLGLIFFSPLMALIAILIKLDSSGPAIFSQKRVGKNGKVFTFYKFRTMVVGAEKLKEKYRDLNEANGPVFKIRDDPRFTRIGKILARTGFDELPQLFNILRGEMSFVGPRPLPVEEERKIEPKYRKKRRLVKPGMTSLWVAEGAQHYSFAKWMESDLEYINSCSLKGDFQIIISTLVVFCHPKRLFRKMDEFLNSLLTRKK